MDRPFSKCYNEFNMLLYTRVPVSYTHLNRQIRRMCEAVGHEVVSLERTAMGPLTLGTLPIGAVRPLTDEELRQIKQVCGLHA